MLEDNFLKNQIENSTNLGSQRSFKHAAALEHYLNIEDDEPLTSEKDSVDLRQIIYSKLDEVFGGDVDQDFGGSVELRNLPDVAQFAKPVYGIGKISG